MFGFACVGFSSWYDLYFLFWASVSFDSVFLFQSLLVSGFGSRMDWVLAWMTVFHFLRSTTGWLDYHIAMIFFKD